MTQNHVIKVSSQTLQEMADTYKKNQLNKTAPYTLFTAKVGATTITAYTSGKVMFQGAGAEHEVSKWGGTTVNKKNTATANKKNAASSQLPPGFDQLSAIGSDEVGNGSYFGPVTVCAAYVEKAMIPKLKALGVRDSKELTDDQIIQLSHVVKEMVPYRLLILEPQKYNEIQPSYNAVHMKVALHNQAIYLLLKDLAPVKPEGILIDQFTPEKNYRKYVAAERNQVTEKLHFITKGEQHHIAVAAASIVCRAAFLESLKDESDQLGFTVPSGAGSKSDQVAARILKQGGLELLSRYAKLHFANTGKAQKLARKG